MPSDIKCGNEILAGIFCKRHGTRWDHRCHECCYMENLDSSTRQLLRGTNDEELRRLIRTAATEAAAKVGSEPASTGTVIQRKPK